jgi:hypothetical protein
MADIKSPWIIAPCCLDLGDARENKMKRGRIYFRHYNVQIMYYISRTLIRQYNTYVTLTSLRSPYSWSLEYDSWRIVHIDRVRLCLWTAATNGPIAIPQMISECEEQRWNHTDRVKPKNSEKNLSQCHFFHNNSTRSNSRAWTRASAVKGQRLIAWAMARLAKLLS